MSYAQPSPPTIQMLAAYQMVHDRKKVARSWIAIGELEQLGLEFRHANALGADLRFPLLRAPLRLP